MSKHRHPKTSFTTHIKHGRQVEMVTAVLTQYVKAARGMMPT